MPPLRYCTLNGVRSASRLRWRRSVCGIRSTCPPAAELVDYGLGKVNRRNCQVQISSFSSALWGSNVSKKSCSHCGKNKCPMSLHATEVKSFAPRKKAPSSLFLGHEGKFNHQSIARTDPVGDQAVLRAGVLLGAHGGHVDVILQFQLGLLVVLSRHELDHEGVLDGKDGVVVEVVALFVEDLRRNWFVAVSQGLWRG